MDVYCLVFVCFWIAVCTSTGLLEANPLLSPEANPLMSPEANPLISPEANPLLFPEANPLLSPEANPLLSPEANPLLYPEDNPVLSPGGIVVLKENEKKLTLTCTYQPNSTLHSFEVRWKKNGANPGHWHGYSDAPCKPIDTWAPLTSSHSCHMIPENNTYIFSITTTVITDADDGQTWQCTIVDFGHRKVTGNENYTDTDLASRVTTVTLHVPPNVTILNGSRVVINEGDSEATLSCSVTGNPLPMVTWNGTDGPIVESLGPATSLDYTLRDIDRSQAGAYSCTAWNVRGKQSAAVLTVDVQFPPYVTILNGSRVVINEGDSEAILSCSVTGNPLPMVTWITANGQTVESLGPATSLDYTLRDIDRSQAGKYSCAAWNARGKQSIAVLEVDVHSERHLHVKGNLLDTMPLIVGGSAAFLIIVVALVSALVTRCTFHEIKDQSNENGEDIGYITPRPVIEGCIQPDMDEAYATIPIADVDGTYDFIQIEDTATTKDSGNLDQYVQTNGQSKHGTGSQFSSGRWQYDVHGNVRKVESFDKWSLNMDKVNKEITKIIPGRRAKCYKRDPQTVNKSDVAVGNHSAHGDVEKQTDV